MTMLDAILAAGPWPIAAALLLATFVVEDWALGAGIALSAEGLIAPGLAMAALCVGIALGDIGLYGMGRYASRFAFIHRRLPAGGVERAERLVRQRLATALVVARMVPGLRLGIHTACGYLGAPFPPFAALVSTLVVAWTAGLFLLGHTVAELAARHLGAATGPFALLPLALVIALPPILRRARIMRRPSP